MNKLTRPKQVNSGNLMLYMNYMTYLNKTSVEVYISAPASKNDEKLQVQMKVS